MKNPIKKVLVVGGAGYIGGAVTDILIKNNIPFTVYDKLLYESQYLKPVDFMFGDVRDTKKLSKILPEYSHVIWLAAIVGDGACQIKPELTIAVNQDSVKWLSENYDGRIIFLSTCSVYGIHDGLADETSPLEPLSLYAKTKLQAEKYLSNKNSLILRLGTVFGVSDEHSRLRMDLVVNYMTARAINLGGLQIFGGEQWRPLVHAKDVAKTIVDGLDKDLGGIYNIATINSKIKDLGQQISDITGSDIEWIEQKFEDLRNYRVITDRAEADGLLNISSNYSPQDGAKEIMDFIKNGRVKYTDSDVYFNERHISNLLKNGELE